MKGYYVYVREATHPYGAPRDTGVQAPTADGTVSWVVNDLPANTSYFIAVSAYTDDRIESALSNELPVGDQNPCMIDSCTSPTQCTVQTLPDGVACGPGGAAGCGATCVAGTCAGLAEHQLALDRVKLKRSKSVLRITASGRFATSAQFNPLATGLTLRVADDDGNLITQATLTASDLVGNATRTALKALKHRGDDGGPIRVRRLVLRVRDDETRFKSEITVSPPPGLPSAATVVLKAGDMCLTAPTLECAIRGQALSCR